MDKGGVHTFPKGISPKVNDIEQLEFKHFNHYTMESFQTNNSYDNNQTFRKESHFVIK